MYNSLCHAFIIWNTNTFMYMYIHTSLHVMLNSPLLNISAELSLQCLYVCYTNTGILTTHLGES